MAPETGAIAEFELDADAKRAGHTIRLTPKEAMVLRALNRHGRRAELSRMRKSARARAKQR